jgi:hypothetical protein
MTTTPAAVTVKPMKTMMPLRTICAMAISLSHAGNHILGTV